LKPFVDNALLPKLQKQLGFDSEHPLALEFLTDVDTTIKWIKSGLKLALEVDPSDATRTVPLMEAGTGIQSAVLLALHRLQSEAAKNPNINYIFAIEEPESFLHPQKQKALYESIRKSHTANLSTLVTTHSPFIVADTPFQTIGLVRKKEGFSQLTVPEIKDDREKQIFEAHASEVNSQIFFAKKIILVEGESDKLVLRELLEKKFGQRHHDFSVLSAGGNRHFSPYLRMLLSIKDAGIPFMVVTDFDSLTKETDRAILTGLKAAGFTLAEKTLIKEIDESILKGESEFRATAKNVSRTALKAGVNLFVFPSDLEFALINDANRVQAAEIMTSESESDVDYKTGYSVQDLKRHIGSKGLPITPNQSPVLKKPFVHKKIAQTIDLSTANPEIKSLLSMIETCLSI
jgi:hypothetical protein